MLGVIGDSNNLGPLMIRVCAAMMCVSAIGVILRLTARRVARQKLWWDDWVIILAMASSFIMAISHIIAVKIGGYGQHVEVVAASPPTLTIFFKMLYVVQIMYPVTIAIIKWSILAFYRRIFAVPATKIPIYLLGVITGAWLIAVVLAAAFSCSPVNGFWDRALMPKCINNIHYYFGQAIPNVVTDICLLVFPLPLIWNLNLPKSQKVSLTAIFAIGALIMVLTCLRIVVIVESNSNPDITYILIPLGIFNVVEANVAIFLASLPSMGPLLRIALQKSQIRSSTQQSPKFTPDRSWPRRKKKKDDTNLSSFTRLYEHPQTKLDSKVSEGQQSSVQTNAQSDNIELGGYQKPGEDFYIKEVEYQKA